MSEFFDELTRRCIPTEVSDIIIQPGQPLGFIRLGEQHATNVVCTDHDFSHLMELLDAPRDWATGGDLNLALVFNGHRLRVHVFRERGKPKVTARTLAGLLHDPKDLRVPTQLTEAMMGYNRGDGGLILVSGATGSGKSTTIASVINKWAKVNKGHIVTLEDPIEVFFKDYIPMQFSQREIGKDVGSFSLGVESAMRETPTIIFIGETKDRASALGALDAAKTGHLVVTTLHTDRVSGAIDSFLRNIPPESSEVALLTLASKLRCVVCQRLYRSADGNSQFAVHEAITIKPGSVGLRSHIMGRKWSAIDGDIAIGSAAGHLSYKDSFARAVADKLIRSSDADTLLHSILGNFK